MRDAHPRDHGFRLGHYQFVEGAPGPRNETLGWGFLGLGFGGLGNSAGPLVLIFNTRELLSGLLTRQRIFDDMRWSLYNDGPSRVEACATSTPGYLVKLSGVEVPLACAIEF